MIRIHFLRSRQTVGEFGPWVWLAILVTVSGCGDGRPAATVEGTLRQQGKPLDNCLVTFLPEDAPAGQTRHSVGRTDDQGHYELRFADQKPGASSGTHRVVLLDLSASTGLRRMDHGDADAEDAGSPKRSPPGSPRTSTRTSTRRYAKKLSLDTKSSTSTFLEIETKAPCRRNAMKRVPLRQFLSALAVAWLSRPRSRPTTTTQRRSNSTVRTR